MTPEEAVAAEAAADTFADEHGEHDGSHVPKGTIVIVSAFLVVTAVVWILTFLMLDSWG